MLSWRVPTTGDPNLLRLALAQVALASIVAALILLVAVPRDWLVAGMLGLIPLAILMAFHRWRTYHQSMVGPDNMRLDENGLFWIDGAGTEQSFRRDEVVGFHVGRDPDTLRPVPALTLHLRGGFESQPIELYPPATSDAVRRLLADDWQIKEQQPSSSSSSLEYDTALAIYCECHDDFQEWHIEGSRTELNRLFDTIDSASQDLPLPPPGAKSLSRTIRCTRREPSRLHVAVSGVPHLDHNTIALPPAPLRELAKRGRDAIASSGDASDLKFDVSQSKSSIWTIHLHLRSD